MLYLHGKNRARIHQATTFTQGTIVSAKVAHFTAWHWYHD